MDRNPRYRINIKGLVFNLYIALGPSAARMHNIVPGGRTCLSGAAEWKGRSQSLNLGHLPLNYTLIVRLLLVVESIIRCYTQRPNQPCFDIVFALLQQRLRASQCGEVQPKSEKGRIMMKAAVMHAVGAPLKIEEVAIPEIGPDEALVETRCCGICGTDLHILKGFGYVPPLPHILGHEPAGVVTRVGASVTALRPGDRVVPHLFLNCNQCYYCRVGRQEQCTNLKGILGVLINGAFAEYFKIRAENLYKLPEQVPFDLGGLIADAVVTSVHAAKRANLHVGDTAVVLGTGGLGLTLIQILKAAGVRTIGMDLSEESLDRAREVGADKTIGVNEPDAASQVEDFTNGFGAQCAFNCVGTRQSMRQSADFVMRCGRIVVIGEEPDFPPINTAEIAQQELEIIGSRNGTRQDMVEAIRLLGNGLVKPPIARRFPLDQINEAFDFMRHTRGGRVVIVVKE